jgi:SAM-dependent methyltransferase
VTRLVRRSVESIRKRGLFGFAKTAASLIATPKMPNRRRFAPYVMGLWGLEIGGPSFAFGDFGPLPLYKHVAALDNCWFAASTLYGEAAPSFMFHEGKAPGRFLIMDGTCLTDIRDGAYDFVLASHVLEHIANPIRALKEWQRVCRPAAAVIVIVPDRARMFDRHRPPTPIRHMVQDYERGTEETDLTHREEFLRLHDYASNRWFHAPEKLAELSATNYSTRAMHHHVFDTSNFWQLLETAGLSVICVEAVRPYHLIGIARAHGE